jgi:hypothetical protein
MGRMRRRSLAASAVALIAVAAGWAAAGSAGAPPVAVADPCSNAIGGGDGPDVLRGTGGGDLIVSRGGADSLAGEGGDDCLEGGPGDDTVLGGAGDDRLLGFAGDDLLLGGDGVDLLAGGGGRDVLRGGSGRDILEGGDGNDRIEEVGRRYEPGEEFDAGSNRIDAGPGRDAVDSANGRRDTVRCGAGRDRATADASDRLIGCERRERLPSPLPGADPGAGGARSSFTISFRSVARVKSPREFFSITVEGPAGSGCRRIVGNSVGVSYTRGGEVRYRLRPFKGLGRAARRWCRGRYTGQASFMRSARDGCGIRPSATPSPSCVEEVRIGKFAFRVR